MNEVHSNAILITNPTNIQYLTGFVGVVENEREAYLLIAKNRKYFFTNSLYLEQAKKLQSSQFAVNSSPLTIIEISRELPLSKKLATICDELKLTSLQFEQDNLTVAEFKQLHKEMPSIALVGATGTIEKLRIIKRGEEIAAIKKAVKLTDDCFAYMLTNIKVGVTESELAWEIESFFRKNKATSAFSPIVAFNEHTSQPHYSPDNSHLKNNTLILFDFGAKVDGHCGDLTRMVVFGKAKEEWAKAYKAVLEGQLAALMYLDNGGASGSEADQLARSTIEKFGFSPYMHSLGHGVGLDIHEAPRLSVKKDVNLKPNMVVTVEPGTYLEGKFGIRIEDMVVVKDHGIDVLSSAPKELLLL